MYEKLQDAIKECKIKHGFSDSQVRQLCRNLKNDISEITYYFGAPGEDCGYRLLKNYG